jgi:hypothetical protein
MNERNSPILTILRSLSSEQPKVALFGRGPKLIAVKLRNSTFLLSFLRMKHPEKRGDLHLNMVLHLRRCRDYGPA